MGRLEDQRLAGEQGTGSTFYCSVGVLANNVTFNPSIRMFCLHTFFLGGGGDREGERGRERERERERENV